MVHNKVKFASVSTATKTKRSSNEADLICNANKRCKIDSGSRNIAPDDFISAEKITNRKYPSDLAALMTTLNSSSSIALSDAAALVTPIVQTNLMYNPSTSPVEDNSPCLSSDEDGSESDDDDQYMDSSSSYDGSSDDDEDLNRLAKMIEDEVFPLDSNSSSTIKQDEPPSENDDFNQSTSSSDQVHHDKKHDEMTRANDAVNLQFGYKKTTTVTSIRNFNPRTGRNAAIFKKNDVKFRKILFAKFKGHESLSGWDLNGSKWIINKDGKRVWDSRDLLDVWPEKIGNGVQTEEYKKNILKFRLEEYCIYDKSTFMWRLKPHLR